MEREQYRLKAEWAKKRFAEEKYMVKSCRSNKQQDEEALKQKNIKKEEISRFLY